MHKSFPQTVSADTEVLLVCIFCLSGRFFFLHYTNYKNLTFQRHLLEQLFLDVLVENLLMGYSQEGSVFLSQKIKSSEQFLSLASTRKTSIF